MATSISEFLLRYGHAVVFGLVFAEQIGAPIPAGPALLAAGALAGQGRMSVAAALAVTVVASLIADLVWYSAGRWRGARVLGLMCRISLEPDSCVRRTENVFARHGVRSLLVAKFVPGLNTVAPPLAGVVGVGAARFVAWDAAGALLWGTAWMGLGYAFSDALDQVAAAANRLGSWLLLLLAGALGLYIAVKYVQRRRFLRSLRIARMAPEDLKRCLDAGAAVTIIDLRAALDVGADPYAIPGARWIAAEEIERRHAEIPRDREIVVYCT